MWTKIISTSGKASWDILKATTIFISAEIVKEQWYNASPLGSTNDVQANCPGISSGIIYVSLHQKTVENNI